MVFSHWLLWNILRTHKQLVRCSSFTCKHAACSLLRLLLHCKLVGTIARFDRGSLNILRAESMWRYLLPRAFLGSLEINRSARFPFGHFCRVAGVFDPSLLRVGVR
jgi:hypothetical protein